MKLNNLQVLRGLAALAVAYAHTTWAPPGWRPFGFFGVEIFFVISGFIMAMTVGRHREAFFRRSLIRILPLCWAGTLLIFLIAISYPHFLRSTRPDAAELVKSLLFIPFRNGSGEISPILFTGWTLNYEMYFYAILAISLLLKVTRPLLLTSALIAAATVACFPFRQSLPVAEFYSNPIVIEFLAGLLAYHIYSNVLSIRLPLLYVLRLTVSIGLLSLIFVDEALTRFSPAEYMVYRPWTLGVIAFVVVLRATLLSRAGSDIKQTFLILLGDASYSLYIVHPYVENLAARVSGRLPWLDPHRVSGQPSSRPRLLSATAGFQSPYIAPSRSQSLRI